jgi:hypothetical protein
VVALPWTQASFALAFGFFYVLASCFLFCFLFFRLLFYFALFCGIAGAADFI